MLIILVYDRFHERSNSSFWNDQKTGSPSHFWESSGSSQQIWRRCSLYRLLPMGYYVQLWHCFSRLIFRSGWWCIVNMKGSIYWDPADRDPAQCPTFPPPLICFWFYIPQNHVQQASTLDPEFDLSPLLPASLKTIMTPALCEARTATMKPRSLMIRARHPPTGSVLAESFHPSHSSQAPSHTQIDSPLWP